VYDPEAGSTLHHLQGHTAPHHPRLVSASSDGTAKVWDGETGEMLADLEGHGAFVMAVAVWTEHTGGHDHDRIATGCLDGHARVWDGKALTLLRGLDCGEVYAVGRLAVLKPAEGPHRLLVAPARDGCVQAWDPEEGRLLHDDILLQRGLPLTEWHLLESAQGRLLVAILMYASRHPHHPGGTQRAFLDVWDLGEAPAAEVRVRPAHHTG
jgi:WD40 repeat protein